MSAKKLTRRQARAWLAPIRACFAQIKSGQVDAVRGYAVTRLHAADDYARIDYCIAGFRGLIARLMPHIDADPLAKIERKLANGVPMTVAEIDAALTLLTRCENELIRHTVEAVKDAVLTEQIQIEMERIAA